jgi:hypothetical protein
LLPARSILSGIEQPDLLPIPEPAETCTWLSLC